MKRTALLIILAMIFSYSTVGARTIIVKVSNIRGEQGTILVMAQAGKESQPVHGKAKPEKGEATIILENVEWEQFDLSVFHDENGNFKMDFTEDKRPAEGYAMKNCKTQQEEDTVKLKLYYPSNE
ncbi:MAG: DUF2141 domain-containing protein [Parabacteroides sp.]|nr:DUF2141 domain-containing protein [Parabacteroides sp.]